MDWIYLAQDRDLREKDQLEDPDLDGRIILKRIFKKWGGGHGLDLSGSGYGQVAGSCECGNEPLGSIKRGEFLDQLRNLSASQDIAMSS